MKEEILGELSKLAETTGVAIEKLYSILMQQSKVQVIYNILTIIGIIAGLIVGIIISRYFFKKAKTDIGYASVWELPGVICGAITAIAGFVGCFIITPLLIGEIIQIFVNPDVWILEYIVKLIK